MAMARQFDIALCLRRSILVEHRYTEDITTRKNMQEALAHTWINEILLLDGLIYGLNKLFPIIVLSFPQRPPFHKDQLWTRISNDMHKSLLDVITRPCIYFKGCLVKLPLMLGCE